MPAVIDKALDFIGGMNTSEPVPQSMDESTAKGILKYLKELGVPAKRIAAGERMVIKHPEFFSTYMQEELRALV
ncbi:MAG: DUF1889 family protein [Klebsiella sp.]|nr:DUF1889 family protein [Klebsiella sp.]